MERPSDKRMDPFQRRITVYAHTYPETLNWLVEIDWLPCVTVDYFEVCKAVSTLHRVVRRWGVLWRRAPLHHDTPHKR